MAKARCRCVGQRLGIMLLSKRGSERRKGSDDVQLVNGNGRRRSKRAASPFLLLLALWATGCGPVDSPVQSTDRPKDLKILDTVKAGGSDRRSLQFQQTWLPTLISRADKEISHAAVVDHFERLVLDPARLELAESCRVRVYFIGEGSGYRNCLGVNLIGQGVAEGDPRIIFPNVNANAQLDACARLVDPQTKQLDTSKLGERTSETPLFPGDFVDLGRLSAGTRLNFFLIANGNEVYMPLRERNPDGMAHMVALAIEGSPYLLLSFEDMFQTGDADFEDCVFAVEMSTYNIGALLGRIDPLRRIKQFLLVAAILGAIIGVPVTTVILTRRARRKRFLESCDHAEALLKSARLKEALALTRTLRQARPDWQALARLHEVEIRVLGAIGDVEGLCNLYSEAPDLFVEQEAPALRVARAQVEAGHLDRYTTLRDAWRDREETPAAWLVLDADTLIKQEHPTEALSLISATRFEGRQEAVRLARLAELTMERDPGEAKALLSQAVALDPENTDVYIVRAEMYEMQGRLDNALKAYQLAFEHNPEDLFVRDRLAEFHRRQGDYAKAIEIWREGLRPPSMDFVWLKVLFWSRVSVPTTVSWDKLTPPRGELHSLVDFLLHLPSDIFWDERAFGPIAERQPEILSRHEAYWLRVLDALMEQNEEQALSLLNLQSFGNRSWRPELETALLRILLYRRSKFLGVAAGPAAHGAVISGKHPLFVKLAEWAQLKTADLPDEAQRFLKSEFAFSAACCAAGWVEAGIRLLSSHTVPDDFPEWARKDLLPAVEEAKKRAAAAMRGEKAAARE